MKGVLFEAMHLFCEKEMSLERMKREPVRSTVCMFFTSWQALHLVLLFDEKLERFFGHGGKVDDALIFRVLDICLQVKDLEPYRPPLLSTEI